MSDETLKIVLDRIPALMSSAAAVMGACGVIILGIMNYRRTGKAIKTSQIALETSQSNAQKIEKVGGDVNGKMALLIQASGAAGRAEGVMEGRLAGIVERADRVAEEERIEDRLTQRAANEADPVKVKIVKPDITE